MAAPLSGPGVGLSLPPTLYPLSLSNGAPYGENTNELALPAGGTMPIPRGTWLVGLGPYTAIQYFDPITTSWRTGPVGQSGLAAQMHVVQSDGFNVRASNLTGCVVGAVISGTDAGGWVQTGTTITASAGGSVWQPVVGGALSTTVSVTAAGSGYGKPPIVIAPSPPSPGIPANFRATISSGTVNSIITVDQGAGYTGSTITLTLIPDPADPNMIAGNAITNATATVPVVGGTATSGSLTGAICTNPGAAVTALPTLTVSGAGSGVTVSPLWLTVASSLSVSVAGAGYSATVLGTSVGGAPGTADNWTNPTFSLTKFIPRPLIARIVSSGGALATGAPAATLDKGLFLTTAAADDPVDLLISNAAPTTVGTLVITLGSTPDTVILQKLS